jgi:response regulator of citrate/malate metabolism
VISTLIVQDQGLSTAALEEFVGRVPGFVVSGIVGTGTETLRRLALERTSLVLLDTSLPDMDGIDVVRTMRAAGYTSDVIVMTDERDLKVVQAAAAYGIVHYLVKPFTFTALQEKLERYRVYYGQLSAAQPFVTQDDIDRILAAVRATGQADVPKRMKREALDAVATIVRGATEGSGLSAAEVAATLGTSRVTARRYLEYLVDLELVSRRPRYAGAHRPKVEYRWRAAQTGDDG